MPEGLSREEYLQAEGFIDQKGSTREGSTDFASTMARIEALASGLNDSSLTESESGATSPEETTEQGEPKLDREAMVQEILDLVKRLKGTKGGRLVAKNTLKMFKQQLEHEQWLAGHPASSMSPEDWQAGVTRETTVILNIILEKLRWTVDYEERQQKAS